MKKIWISVSVLISVLLLSVCLFFTVLRWLDRDICAQNIGRRLNIDPTFSSILRYVRETDVENTPRADVWKRLEKLGPIRLVQTSEVAGDHVEIMVIDTCLHPMNRIYIHAVYTSDEKLKYIVGPDD